MNVSCKAEPTAAAGGARVARKEGKKRAAGDKRKGSDIEPEAPTPWFTPQCAHFVGMPPSRAEPFSSKDKRPASSCSTGEGGGVTYWDAPHKYPIIPCVLVFGVHGGLVRCSVARPHVTVLGTPRTRVFFCCRSETVVQGHSGCDEGQAWSGRGLENRSQVGKYCTDFECQC